MNQDKVRINKNILNQDSEKIIENINANDLLLLYKTYEFSDRLFLANIENTSYPSLYNYVDTGILTKQELEELIKTNESRK